MVSRFLVALACSRPPKAIDKGIVTRRDRCMVDGYRTNVLVARQQIQAMTMSLISVL